MRHARATAALQHLEPNQALRLTLHDQRIVDNRVHLDAADSVRKLDYCQFMAARRLILVLSFLKSDKCWTIPSQAMYCVSVELLDISQMMAPKWRRLCRKITERDIQTDTQIANESRGRSCRKGPQRGCFLDRLFQHSSHNCLCNAFETLLGRDRELDFEGNPWTGV